MVVLVTTSPHILWRRGGLLLLLNFRFLHSFSVIKSRAVSSQSTYSPLLPKQESSSSIVANPPAPCQLTRGSSRGTRRVPPFATLHLNTWPSSRSRTNPSTGLLSRRFAVRGYPSASRLSSFRHRDASSKQCSPLQKHRRLLLIKRKTRQRDHIPPAFLCKIAYFDS